MTGWIAILEILSSVYLCQIIVVSENERHLSVRDRCESKRSNTQKHLCAVSHSGAVMTSHVKIFLHYKFDLVTEDTEMAEVLNDFSTLILIGSPRESLEEQGE